MSYQTIEVTFDISTAIMDVRYAQREFERAEAVHDEIEQLAGVDRRTKAGRFYKQVNQRLLKAIDELRHARLFLGKMIAECELSDETLIEVQEDVVAAELDDIMSGD